MLRNRIFVGVAPLIILWMMVGGYAVWLFFRLGNAVNTTLHENYTSIAAMRDLKEAAGRIERTLSNHHDGGSHRISEQARSTLEQQAAICRRNVEAEMGIITESGEREAAERLRACDDAFLQTISSAFIAGNIKAIDLRRPLNDLLDAATTVQGINEQAMTEKDQHDLAMQVDKYLPPVAISVDQLSHVFSNAAKHSPTGEEIVVAAKTEGHAVRFSVTDHGPSNTSSCCVSASF